MYEELISFYQKQWCLESVKKYLDTPSSILFKVIYKQKPAVLKVFKNNSDEIKSGVILKAYVGVGTVKIYHHTDSAILMQEINPAYELADLTKSGNDNDATMIFCDVVKKLHSKRIVSESLLPISDLGQGFQRYKASSNRKISDDLLRKAQRIFFDLEATQKNKVILHGDLHHFNILYDDVNGWLAIDPKGYIGEPEFEIAAYLKNPIGFSKFFLDKQIIKQRIQIIEDQLGYDRDRMLKWAFTLTILSVIWNIEEKQDYTDWLQLAEFLDDLLDELG
jgi:streptomycin 6-kinase